MVELKGSLGSIGLPAIVQLLGELHHTGNLELTKDGARGVLGFDDGRLVAASHADQRGPAALAACVLELADSDFVFVEGAPAAERTLDLAGSDVQKYLRQIMSGEIRPETLEPPTRAEASQALGICPLLGFVDDAARHYSRPTALHRCFASGSPSLVTAQEQRELCMSGRYPTCPRYRNGSNLRPTGAQREAVAQPVASPLEAGSPSGIPPRVAARMAAVGQMRMADSTSAEAVPARIGPDDQSANGSPKVDAGPFRPERRPMRVGFLVAIGAVLGLIVLVGGLLIVRPALTGGLTPNPTSPVAQRVDPVPTIAPTIRTLPTAVAAPAPTPAPTVGAPPQPTVRPPSNPAVPIQTSVAPATVPTASAVPAPGQALIDVRFASGPTQGWLDNPPYATWSDGAYRLQAREATRFVAVGVPLDRLLGNVVVSATFRKTGGPPGGGYGLIVRDQSPDPLDGVSQIASAYVLETGDLGEFGVWRRDGDHWVDLVPWTRSDSVRPGGSPNDLMVRAIGGRLIFIVNATEIASVQDDTLPSGGVGVFIGGDYNEVALDRFAVQVLD